MPNGVLSAAHLPGRHGQNKRALLLSLLLERSASPPVQEGMQDTCQQAQMTLLSTTR